MDTASPSQRTAIRFGVFEVDCLAGELRKQGVRIKLHGQPFQVLQVLLEKPGQTVTREQLRQRIWPADTFVDFEGGVNNAVKRLREALGDNAEDPRFIETLPRRGYRFIGTIDENRPTAHADESPSIANRPTVPPASRRGLQTVSLIGLGLVALVIAMLALVPRTWLQRLRGSSDLPAIHSLAVLPLQNLSGDPGQDYFADGMTEELITDLSNISALRVISRTSIMRYRKSDKSLPEIARELNVDAIVEGSVVRSSDRVRITAQLIYAPQDKNVWARSYQSEVQDALTLQSEVASAIAEEVRASLTRAEQVRFQAVRPANLKALEAYFQGNYHFSQFGNGLGFEAAEKALDYFNKAIAEDPGFAQAYLRIADVYYQERNLLPGSKVAPLEKAAAKKALALNPALAEAHVHMGSVKLEYEWDWQGAETEFHRAIDLNPNSAEAHERLGDYLDAMGRLPEGMEQHQRAQELDPANDHLFNAFYRSRRYDEGIALFTKEVQLDPNIGDAHWVLSEYYAQKGMYKESIQQLQLAATLYGAKDLAKSLGEAYENAGYKGAIREFIRFWEKLYSEQQAQPVLIAEFYTRVGDKERALRWLQTAYEARDAMCWLKVDPHWDPLRSDPRFADLVRRVGLPP